MKETKNIYTAATIISLFEKSVVENEKNIALIFNNTRLTYHHLNACSNKIANLLITKGVKPGTLIPICLNSSIELICSIIGILKAGGAYIPVDPDYPADRIKYILNDCNAAIIVTSPLLRSKAGGRDEAEIVEIDNNVMNSAVLSEENPDTGITTEDLAYIMYTSGTTGVPNGVMIEHHSVVNNLSWAKNYFKIGINDVVLQKTNFCFDVSVWEIFWPLISGSALVIIDKRDYKDLQSLQSFIALYNVTAIHFVPAMLEFFLLSIAGDWRGNLKHVISSGEALTPFQANLLKEKLPGARLHNLYGPTETTIHSSYWEMPPNVVEIDTVYIGKPVANTEIFILNEQGELQAEGSIGEIYIGGEGLARGYLNKPDLTKKRFKISALSSYNGRRLYKTGDYGRFINKEDIEYLGRVDDQVKINGYRIELQSIEANIKNSGIVKHAVVLSTKNALKAMQIVAYVVLEAPNDIQDLWDHLVLKLPGYMLPTSIKAVENIPFTSNGKIDRELLLRIGSSKDTVDKIILPRTESEKIVTKIWRELFNNDSLGIYSNFFDLGGNSIMAVKMLALLKKETGKHISLLLLNQYPTIESLSKLLKTQNLLKIPNVLVSIRPGGNKPPLYLVNGGELVDDGFFNLGDALDKEQPIYGFQSNGYDSNGKLFDTIEDIAAFYVKSLLNHDSYGPYCLAGYSLGGIICFEMAKQLKAMGKEIKLLAMIDSLTRDPGIIKTRYNFPTVIKIIGLNIYLLRYGFTNAVKFFYGLTNALLKKIKRDQPEEPESTAGDNITDKENNFNVFGMQIAAYKKYNLLPYDGNMVVFRAKRITFYMDDYKYLGWKDYVKKIKNITIRGDHYTIFDDANIEDFGKKMQAVLDEGF